MEQQIIVAAEAGACFGVERALELVEKTVSCADGQVCTLGSLIHNPAVVSNLESRGVSVAATPDEAAGATLILRTHGVTPAEAARAGKLCCKVVDATCPFVAKAQRAAELLAKEGYRLIILGEEGHPEVVGIAAHAPGALVVEEPEALEKSALGRRVGVVVQTTQTEERLTRLAGWLAPRVDELKVINTICDATAKRQAAAVELASKVDVMLVVGGRSSANTRHLAELCELYCERSFHIESAAELESSWFEDCQTIGITAGASTPQSQIASVQVAVEQLCTS